MEKHTTLSQSKKLAEFLPLESADMHYNNASIKGVNYVDNYRAELMDYNTAVKVLSKYSLNPLFEIVPCWSLDALLDILPYPSLHKTHLGWRCDSYDKEGTTCRLGENKNSPIDACVEMILKLHNENVL